MITFTVDLEDPTEHYEADGRYVAMTQRILTLCTETNRRATFFTVGKLAQSAPMLITEIAKAGHEIAYHSHAHVSLTQEDRKIFRQQSHDDKDRLEQLAGKPVVGFRAPRFSLTPQSIWTLDILAEIGFRYSSSIMPTQISRFGFAEAKRTPFKWPNGMVEFPLPVKEIAGQRIPYLGGIYLYALPSFVTHSWAKNADLQEVLWTYTHPYDFDREDPFSVMPNTSFAISAILWCARRVAEKKLRRILELPAGLPLGERLT